MQNTKDLRDNLPITIKKAIIQVARPDRVNLQFVQLHSEGDKQGCYIHGRICIEMFRGPDGVVSQGGRESDTIAELLEG